MPWAAADLTANGGVVDIYGYSLTTTGSNALPWLSGTAGTITDSSYAPSTTLCVNQNGNTTFGGSLQSGPNGCLIALQKYGNGSLTLSGTSNLASVAVGNTGTDTGGTLNVKGSVTTPAFAVDDPAELAGGGAIILTTAAGLLDYDSSALDARLPAASAGPAPWKSIKAAWSSPAATILWAGPSWTEAPSRCATAVPWPTARA